MPQPSLGVSSLDLGRPTWTALFLCVVRRDVLALEKKGKNMICQAGLR
jgi:hypothetical protein